MDALRIIKHVIEKQPVEVEVAFKEAMKPAVSASIETKRAEVGANLFKQSDNNTE